MAFSETPARSGQPRCLHRDPLQRQSILPNRLFFAAQRHFSIATDHHELAGNDGF
jgi:hypothetical protein